MAETNGLPKSIEAATSRYLFHYESYFKGPRDEMRRLKKLAEASIFLMRKKAPNFYEKHLATLVNQAASALLACDTNTPDGSRKFHESHRNFLKVLDELKKTQPQGEINFQTEVQRVQEKDTLLKKQVYMRNKISELEATEIDCDEMGSDEVESQYNKIFNELDKHKTELKKISKMIAKLEGEDLDMSREFKLLIPDGSALVRLTVAQCQSLESQIIEYLKQNRNKKMSMYVDKSIIDGMIAKLNLRDWSLVDINNLSRDALDAYKQHFRNIENERREEFYESLLQNQHLRPKEGLILESPEDVPDDIKQRLDQSDRRYKRKLDECFEEFARQQPENLDENASADVIEDDDASSSDGIEFLDNLEEFGHLFKRVKEEPRYDYDNEAPSDDEIIVPSNQADEIEGMQNGRSTNQNASSSYSSPEHYSSSSREWHEDDYAVALPHPENGNSQDLEMLGLVAPADKIPVIEIDDD